MELFQVIFWIVWVVQSAIDVICIGLLFGNRIIWSCIEQKLIHMHISYPSADSICALIQKLPCWTTLPCHVLTINWNKVKKKIQWDESSEPHLFSFQYRDSWPASVTTGVNKSAGSELWGIRTQRRICRRVSLFIQFYPLHIVSITALCCKLSEPLQHSHLKSRLGSLAPSIISL